MVRLAHSRWLERRCRLRWLLLVLILTACTGPGPTAPFAELAVTSEPVCPGENRWEGVPIPGKALTQYTADRQQDVWAWRADADHSASMWRHRILPPVPGERLGLMEFSWWVDRLVRGAELQTMGMGDSPARLVLAFDGDKSRLSMKNRVLMDLAEALTGEPSPYATLIYVWSNELPLETLVIHPRSDRIRKVVVEQGATALRQWRHYQRNVAKDFERAFGELPGALTAVAWMADADNMASTALTWFGDIRLQGLPPLGASPACPGFVRPSR